MLALGLLLSACGNLPTSLEGEASALAVHRAKWDRSGVTSYRYTVLRACECNPSTTVPIVVEVVDGEIQSLAYAASGTSVEPQWASIFPTVPGLFDIIRDAVERQAAGLSVRYDSALGYPVSIQVDYVAGILDDEVTWRVTDFRVR